MNLTLTAKTAMLDGTRQPECICLLSDDEDGYSLERAIECD